MISKMFLDNGTPSNSVVLTFTSFPSDKMIGYPFSLQIEIIIPTWLAYFTICPGLKIVVAISFRFCFAATNIAIILHNTKYLYAVKKEMATLEREPPSLIIC